MNKKGRRPTRAQQILLKNHNLDPDNWLIMRDSPDIFQIKNRLSGSIRMLNRKAGKAS